MLVEISAEVQLFHSWQKTVPENFTNVSFLSNELAHKKRGGGAMSQPVLRYSNLKSGN